MQQILLCPAGHHVRGSGQESGDVPCAANARSHVQVRKHTTQYNNQMGQAPTRNTRE